ncbi:rhomboid protease (macronuclear) [Tetrahymena thermophila SB210]|uniref:Rhomboid-like protease n=1 Tax=Tetrahymena thermophila (strain SB210) TaxID=312017 RepID=Q22SB6_TETTS|nr:rhomboid protease [Tetrahymena thermophila SB210]EAR87856.1 rhomboid protease [Tetrahymena thermophila SB210]|eukprot:XP_001008101.1 rhomboid protease [Tetrahymena thermophila SB210]
MANIHRLNDDGFDRRLRLGFSNPNQNQILDPNLKIPFVSQVPPEEQDPRKESFWQMLKINLCPSFKINSITFSILVINSFVFVLECYQTTGFGQSLLEINQKSLIDMGAVVPIDIREKGQYYRVLFAMFMHASFVHLLFNQISLFIILSAIEYSYGLLNTTIIYLLSGIGANMLAANFGIDYDIYVGCSGAVTGLLACVLSYFILNWNKLEVLGPMREYILCIFIMFMLLAFLFPGPSSISTYSNIGGFLAGLFSGLAIPEPAQQGSYEKYAKISGWVLLSTFFVLILLSLYIHQ